MFINSDIIYSNAIEYVIVQKDEKGTTPNGLDLEKLSGKNENNKLAVKELSNITLRFFLLIFFLLIFFLLYFFLLCHFGIFF